MSGRNVPPSNNATPPAIVGLQFLKEILEFPVKYEGLPTAEKVLRPRKK